MTKKILAALCGLALIFAVTSVRAEDGSTATSGDNAGYNTSSSDSVTVGTNPYTGGEAPGDAQAMQNIQADTQSMKERWSGSAQRDAVENGN